MINSMNFPSALIYCNLQHNFAHSLYIVKLINYYISIIITIFKCISSFIKMYIIVQNWLIYTLSTQKPMYVAIKKKIANN